MAKKVKKNPGGRPTLFTKELVAKLEEAYCLGFTDEQAGIFAGVSKDAIYEYCKKHPSFATKKELLKQTPLLKAKMVVNRAIDLNDVTTSKWYLERKCKDEFSTRNELTGKDGEALIAPTIIDDVPNTRNPNS